MWRQEPHTQAWNNRRPWHLAQYKHRRWARGHRRRPRSARTHLNGVARPNSPAWQWEGARGAGWGAASAPRRPWTAGPHDWRPAGPAPDPAIRDYIQTRLYSSTTTMNCRAPWLTPSRPGTRPCNNRLHSDQAIQQYYSHELQGNNHHYNKPLSRPAANTSDPVPTADSLQMTYACSRRPMCTLCNRISTLNNMFNYSSPMDALFR